MTPEKPTVKGGGEKTKLFTKTLALPTSLPVPSGLAHQDLSAPSPIFHFLSLSLLHPFKHYAPFQGQESMSLKTLAILNRLFVFFHWIL